MLWDLKGDGSFDPAFFFVQKYLQIVNKPTSSSRERSLRSPEVQEDGMELQVHDNIGAIILAQAASVPNADSPEVTDDDSQLRRDDDNIQQDNSDERPRTRRRVEEPGGVSSSVRPRGPEKDESPCLPEHLRRGRHKYELRNGDQRGSPEKDFEAEV